MRDSLHWINSIRCVNAAKRNKVCEKWARERWKERRKNAAVICPDPQVLVPLTNLFIIGVELCIDLWKPWHSARQWVEFRSRRPLTAACSEPQNVLWPGRWPQLLSLCSRLRFLHSSASPLCFSSLHPDLPVVCRRELELLSGCDWTGLMATLDCGLTNIFETRGCFFLLIFSISLHFLQFYVFETSFWPKCETKTHNLKPCHWTFGVLQIWV